MWRLLVMASNYGSNFEAIVKHFKDLNVEIELLCDNKEARVLELARQYDVKAHLVEFEKTIDFFEKNKDKYHLVAMAGYMRILPKEVLKCGKFVNIHPSLLPKFKGKNAIEQAFFSTDKYSGITIHHVNESVDDGEIIVQEKVEIPLDLKTFREKIHALEHKLYPSVIERLLQ